MARASMTAGVLIAGLMAFSLAGCRDARGPHLARAGAPSLGMDGEPRNAANPNAPFAVPAGSPQLRARPQILDINGVLPCVQEQLTLFESGAQSSGAHHTARIAFENTGSACRLGGFPSITLLRADGSVAGSVQLEKVSRVSMAATLKSGSGEEAAFEGPAPQVLLPSHGEAAFELGWITGPECERIGRIAIGAPGSTRPTLLPRPLTVCEDRILVTAVAPPDADHP